MRLSRLFFLVLPLVSLTGCLHPHVYGLAYRELAAYRGPIETVRMVPWGPPVAADEHTQAQRDLQTYRHGSVCKERARYAVIPGGEAGGLTYFALTRPDVHSRSGGSRERAANFYVWCMASAGYRCADRSENEFCREAWTHPTATRPELFQDHRACLDTRRVFTKAITNLARYNECMIARGYRKDVGETEQERAEFIGADEADAARDLVQEPPPNTPSETATRPAPDPAAAQGAESTINPTTPEGTSGREAQLERLSSLRARGEITEDEYTILRRRVLETPVRRPERTSSVTTPAPSGRSAASGELKWPPVNSRALMSVRTSGSFGSGSHLQTVYFLGERDWQGRKAFAFSNGSVTTYADARRRTLGRAKSDVPLESFEPYFVLAEWPLVVGKRWPNRYRHHDYVAGRRFEDVQYDGKVEALEDVKTPAGTFKAFRIHLGGISSNTILWYSSDLGIFIKTRNERFSNHYLGSGVREAELVVYAER